MLQKQHVCFLIAFLFVLVKSQESPAQFEEKIEKYVKSLFSEKCVCFNKMKILTLTKNLQILS